MCAACNEARTVAVDCETTGLHWWEHNLYAISFSDGREAWVCLGEYLARALAYARAVLGNKEFTVVGHNIKFDLHFLMDGAVPRCKLIDTSVALHLLNENADNGLKPAVRRMFGYQMRSFKDVMGRTTEETGEERVRKCQACRCTKSRMPTCETCTGTGAERVPKMRTRMRRIDEIPAEELAVYSGEDAYFTLHLWSWAMLRLAALPEIERAFFEIQMPLVAAVYRMEHKGVLVDVLAARKMRDDYVKRIIKLDAKLATIWGDVNPASPQQVDNYLYGVRKHKRPPFRPKRKTPEGSVASKYQTDEACLIWLAMEQNSEVAKLLLDRRELAKLKGTYLDAIIEHNVDGVLYPNFNMATVVTGRWSSSDPINFQNQPKVIRVLYRARPGHKFLVADLAQAELRLLAHYSQDEALLSAYLSNPPRDLHQELSDELHLTEYAGGEARTAAKRGNFGLAYGVWVTTFRRQVYVDTHGKVALTHEQGEEILTGLQARYSGVGDWKRHLIRLLRERGYATTLEGRRRRLPGVHSANWGVRAYAERQGVNVLIQGGVADIINRAMVNIHKMMPGLKRLQVHDEVVLEVPEDKVDFFAQLVNDMVQDAVQTYDLSVPMPCDVKIGDTWGVK